MIGEPAVPEEDETLPGPGKQHIAAAQRMRDDRVAVWQKNVDKRKAGKGSESTEQDVSINKDWSLTKAKIAQLASGQPEIRLTPRAELFAPAVQVFGRSLNDVMTDANAIATVQEELADVTNASGISGCLISCEALTEMKLDPMTGMEAPMPSDRQYLVQRISPPDLLIPSDFAGSDYNKARWLGREGRMTWVEAQRILGLTEEQRADVLSGDKRASNTNSTLNTDSNKFRDDDVVTYQELFYWRHFYHVEETKYKALQHRVFVDGLDKPVIDEPYRGQTLGTDGNLVGVLKNPIQILTLTYISDEALPPSDSTISRYQVDELERYRRDLELQRKHSIPIRAFNPSLVSPNARANVEKGTHQGMIPISGQFDRAIGVVQQAALPPERGEFASRLSADVDDIWQIGANQSNSFSEGDHSATEARVIQQNFQTRISQERDRVTKHWVGIAEVLAGHLALYGQFELPAGLDKESIANGFVYSVRVDSTVLLDSHHQIEQIKEYVNMWGQSGVVNIKFFADKHAELIGFNPAEATQELKPKPPEPVKISIGSAEDIVNPLMLAALAATNQLPAPEHVAAVVKLLQTLEAVPGMAEMLVPKEPVDPNQEPGEADRPGIHNADWQEQPRLNKRDQDGGA